MAKKKATKPARKAPSTPCPACGKPNHPRKTVCQHCGKEIRKATPKKKAAPKKKVAAKAAPAGDLKSALKAEKAKLQKQMDAIDTLLGE